MEPLISVIIPIYNSSKYLHKCINSVLEQSYKNLEIILIDDGSTDDSGNICDEFSKIDDRIHVIHKRNEGQAIARNVGLDICNGDYVTFVDSDDWIDLKYYEIMIKEIDNKSLIISGYKLVDELGKFIKCVNIETEVFCFNKENYYKILQLIYNSVLGFPWNKIYKASVINDIRYKELMPREDLVFNLNILNNINEIGCIDINGYNWRQRSNSTSHGQNSNKINKVREISNELVKIESFRDNKCKSSMYNIIMKILIADIIMVDIMKNDNLSIKGKIKNISLLMDDNKIRKNLKVCKNDIFYYKVLVLCFKHRCSILLFLVSLILK